tara:strand:- start:25633 stop:26679 length:1047 start_codon:yes stop_codon:yes gene_type:complete
MTGDLVLVTGASGFVGKWTVIELLRAGFSVRGSVRSEATADSVRRAVVAALGDEVLYRLSFVKLDLMLDNGWLKAMLKVDAIVHSAAQVLGEEPRDTRKVIGPAVDGTERVMRFATLTGVRRVVVTSSAVTIGYGHQHANGQRIYSEVDFTDLAAVQLPWADCIGKTKAERVAWAYARNEDLNVTTIHPGLVLGPVLDDRCNASVKMVLSVMQGSLPALPRCGLSVVDVRDVALMHVAALRHAGSIGERYLAASDYVSFPQMAAILASAYPHLAITRRIAPDWVVRLLARFGGSARLIVNDIGKEKYYARAKGEALLGKAFSSGESTILTTAQSLVAGNLLQAPQLGG